jgi:hypothetical protein
MDHTHGYCIPDPGLDLSTHEVLQRTPEFDDFLAYAELRELVGRQARYSNFPMIGADDHYVMSRFQAPLPGGM